MTPTILQQLRSTLIDGEFPSETVTIHGVPFEFTFTDRDISLCETVSDYVNFLSKNVTCSVRGEDVPLTSLPSTYFHPLHEAYSTFQFTTAHALLDAVTEFTKSDESRGLWMIYSHSGPTDVLSVTRKLNLVQQQWVMLHSTQDKSSNLKMVADIFEAAKPWLNAELYMKLKEHEDNTRENAFFDNGDAFDQELRDKARKIAEQQRQVAETSDDGDDDGDIVVVDEEID